MGTGLDRSRARRSLQNGVTGVEKALPGATASNIRNTYLLSILLNVVFVCYLFSFFILLWLLSILITGCGFLVWLKECCQPDKSES